MRLQHAPAFPCRMGRLSQPPWTRQPPPAHHLQYSLPQRQAGSFTHSSISSINLVQQSQQLTLIAPSANSTHILGYICMSTDLYLSLGRYQATMLALGLVLEAESPRHVRHFPSQAPVLLHARPAIYLLDVSTRHDGHGSAYTHSLEYCFLLRP
jgi:hypothetical protein